MGKVEQELEIRKRKIAWKKKYDELYLGMLMPNERHKQRIQSKKLKEDVYKCENAWHAEPHLESLNGKDDWLVEQIEYGECSICGHELLVEDYERGELICEGCGTVQGTQVYERNQVHATLEALPNNDQIRKEEWQVIFLERRRKARLESTKEKQVHAKKPQHRTDMKTYRRNQYLLALNSISSQLHMTHRQTDAVKNIILDDRYKLKDFHSKAKNRTIIAGLCRFVIKTAGRSNGDLRYSLPAFRDNNLDKDKYKIIAMNIVEKRIMSLMR